MGNCARNGSHIYSPCWSEGIKNTFGTSIVTFLAWNNTQNVYKNNKQQQQLRKRQMTFKDKEHRARHGKRQTAVLCLWTDNTGWADIWKLVQCCTFGPVKWTAERTQAKDEKGGRLSINVLPPTPITLNTRYTVVTSVTVLQSVRVDRSNTDKCAF